jgi:CopG family transcriptional regulator/antitoxin EndoAI
VYGGWEFMTEVNHMLPMIKNSKSDEVMESLVLYLKEKRDIYERLKCGYCEMSHINLTLAELGLEEDMLDLCRYELELRCETS